VRAAVRLCDAAVVVLPMEELCWRSFLLRFVITLFPAKKSHVTPRIHVGLIWDVYAYLLRRDVRAL
jgi:hypothetical protein